MKTRRNAPCTCGSRKKFKKCCGSLSLSGTRSTSSGSLQEKTFGICFSCAISCAESCCGGATLVTVEEIKQCYDVFPITIGFRKYVPIDEEHRDFLDAVGIRSGRKYIVGDFVAGNRYAARCAALSADNLCMLHTFGKRPAQCQLVPFCALYPEEKQDLVIDEQRRGKFFKCQGFMSPENHTVMVWKEGRFIDTAYRNAYYTYQRGLLKQWPITIAVLNELKKQVSFYEFLKGDGILEVAIPAHLLDDVLSAAGFPSEEFHCFVRGQQRVCMDALRGEGIRNQVLEDWLEVLKTIEERTSSYQ
jgi:SEC-C motif